MLLTKLIKKIGRTRLKGKDAKEGGHPPGAAIKKALLLL
jgi:hypothetical protein